MKKLWILVLLFLTSGFSRIALAKATKEIELGEVVVTATKTETPVSQVGAAITVITEAEIKQSQTIDVLELLQSVPGLNIVQTGSRGGTAALHPRGGESNFTLVLIDGVQVNDAGGDYDFANLTTDNIERIEVVRGPHSALYGSDAMGGVINIITKQGKEKSEAYLSTAWGYQKGNYNNQTLIAEQKAGISGGGENYGYSLAFARIDDNGILEVNSDYENNTFSGRFDFSPRDTVDLSFTMRYEDSRYEFPTSFGDRFDKDDPGLDPNQYSEKEALTTGLKANHFIFPWWEQQIQLGLSDRDSLYRDKADPEVKFFGFTESAFSSQTDERRLTADYLWNFRCEKDDLFSSVLTLGVEREENELKKSSISSFSSSYRDESRKNNAFYFQEQLSLWERLFLTGGFRLDDNSSFGTEFSPRGSIAFLIKETGTKLRGAGGKGIKAPTFTENFYETSTLQGNPDLDPEKVISWEAGFDQTIQDGLIKIGATYFSQQFEDLIGFTGDAKPDSAWKNIQKAESRGVEAELQINPGYGLSIGGNFTYLETKVTGDGNIDSASFERGKKLLRRPMHTWSGYTNWNGEGLNLNARGTYVGERDDIKWNPDYSSKRVKTPCYFKLDLAVSYDIPVNWQSLEKVKVFAKAENVLNRKYEETYGYSTARFSFLSGVSFHF